MWSIAPSSVVYLSLLLLLSQPVKGQFFYEVNRSKTLTIEFNSEHDFILVQVRFANVLPLNFIFDTGSEHTILFKKEYADLLGVQYDRKIPLYGADMAGQIYAYIARAVEMTIQDHVKFTSDVLVMETDYLQLEEFTGINIDGILGANLFRHLVLHINNKKDKISFIAPNRFKGPGSRYLEFPIEVQQSKPYITLPSSVNGTELKLKLLMDTGASLPLLLYINTHPDLAVPENTILGNLGMGLGGFLQGYIGRVEYVDFVNHRFDNLVASFQDFEIDSAFFSRTKRNGLIGNSMLSRYNLYIDYSRNKAYFKPNRKFRRKFRYDKSGLVIVAAGAELNNFIVQRVVPNSPAADVGLKQGDLIKSVQGIPTTFYTLAGINSKLSSKAGKRIKLVISRNGERLKKSLRLRELI
ncbi:MAG: aspartyl protease family protein [Saprospiraceae bacterium]|nr:aspartyl protease family protein [Saprospiraceae bacterium]